MLVKKPLISVLMTAYNREKFIGEAIDSVLASTFTDFELIILDDYSNDNTVAIAKQFALTDNRVKVFVNDKNIQQFPNRNKAASLAQGIYLKYVDSDDTIYPDCLEVTIKAMRQYPGAAVGCEHKSKSPYLPIVYTPIESYRNHYFNSNPLLFTGPTDCIFRRDVFELLGGFPEDEGILADTLFMLKIAATYEVVGFRTGLTFYRMHDQQVTIDQLDWAAMLIQRNKINDFTLKSPDCPFCLKERNIVSRNLKSILVRNLLSHLINLDFKSVYTVYKKTGLTLLDCVKAILPNKKLSNINTQSSPNY